MAAQRDLPDMPDWRAAGALNKLRFESVPAASLLRLTRSPTTEPYFGRRGCNRFDDPLKQFGVLYAAGHSRTQAFEHLGIRRQRIVNAHRQSKEYWLTPT